MYRRTVGLKSVPSGSVLGGNDTTSTLLSQTSKALTVKTATNVWTAINQCEQQLLSRARSCKSHDHHHTLSHCTLPAPLPVVESCWLCARVDVYAHATSMFGSPFMLSFSNLFITLLLSHVHARAQAGLRWVQASTSTGTGTVVIVTVKSQNLGKRSRGSRAALTAAISSFPLGFPALVIPVHSNFLSHWPQGSSCPRSPGQEPVTNQPLGSTAQ